MNAHELGRRIGRLIVRDRTTPGPTCERCGKAPASFPCVCEPVYCGDCYAIIVGEGVTA